MGGYIPVDLIVGEEVGLPLDDDVLHTAHIVDLPGVQAEPAGPGVGPQEQRVVGVGGTHARDSNTRLGEDLVDRQSDNILGLDGVDLVPPPVTELKLICLV